MVDGFSTSAAHGRHIVLSEAGHPLLGDAATLRIFWAHVREEEGDALELPEPFLKKCIAELLYTEDGAAVACRIIERAEPREIIYQRCMDVRTATAHAVAVEPGRVQSLASWTPEDEDPTVSRHAARRRRGIRRHTSRAGRAARPLRVDPAVVCRRR